MRTTSLCDVRASLPPVLPSAVAARRIVLAGGVQGLGVRPAIYRLASELDLCGTVRNTLRGVEIEVEGSSATLCSFEIELPHVLPAAAHLVQVESSPLPTNGRGQFKIIQEPPEGPLTTCVPADRAVCSRCLGETEDRADRRYSYPFTSCTQCGPRYTVVRSMPFEREDTAMGRFPLCLECRQEYEGSRDRRFHAQTMSCADCGPRVVCCEVHSAAQRSNAIELQSVAAQLGAGRIVALRGLGGYQLLVDATNDSAVARLRARKQRRAKPLAVMVESADAARQLAHFDDEELAAFADPSGPIVLVRAQSNNGLASGIHPQLNTVGLMRPTTPLHAMLARACGRPLVCTSANVEGEPLEYKIAGAERHLAGMCDLWVHHNRDIVRPIDDSVVRVIAGRRTTIRLARGLAPLPLELPPMQPTLALGGYLKAAVAWSNGEQAVLGPHIGDQESLAARERFVDHLRDMQQLYRFQADRIVHDLHPEYFSTRWAQQQQDRARQVVAVQHHHAHVAAAMLEHRWLDREVLGVAWDGTGYGTDDTIWGGEFLRCTAATFERVARLRPFRLPGGEAAIHEPWRIALSLCSQLDPSSAAWNRAGISVPSTRVEAVARILHRPQLSPVTSSAGRLFDAAAAVILGIERADFDGQPAMRLEAVVDRSVTGSYNFPLVPGDVAELDWRPLLTGLLADRERGAEPAQMAMRFHRSLAVGIIQVCRAQPTTPVVLTGGVFQNRLLTELVAELHDDASQPLGLPGLIPVNDGGLAAGQVAVVAAGGGIAACV